MNNYKENECSCKICQNMCKTPCIGTPLEMGKISVAGFRDRLSVTFWAYGKLVGTHDKFIKIIAPTYDEKRECCTFFKDGKCELHNLGLKQLKVDMLVMKTFQLITFKNCLIRRCTNA